jgi:UDP-glucose 4-epimerase
MKVLVVTGHDGFIGRSVCREADSSGIPVVAIGRVSRLSQPGGCRPIRLVDGAISVETLERATEDVQPIAIIHCAGTGTVRRATEAPYCELERSVGTTAIALEFIRTRLGSSTKFVIASSASVYGDTSAAPAVESTPCAPMSAYGFQKLMTEQLCQCYSQQFGIPVMAVRLFSVYGPGLRKQLPWDAMLRMRAGDMHFDCTGRELRDWLHVSDAAQLLCRAAIAPQEGWNVVNGSGHRATTEEVLRILAESSGIPAEPTFSGIPQPSNPMSLVGSSSKAANLLGWTPRVELRTGLAEFAAWQGLEARRR